MTWTDTHCHLEDSRYPESTDEILRAARERGVSRFITVGCDAESSRTCLDIATRHDDVWATIGLHPHEAVHGIETLDDLLNETLADENSRSRLVAVGEAGLDYYYDHSPRDTQREMFAAQIALAHRHRLPLVIHTRDAWNDTWDVLVAEGVPANTVFHCFTGGPEEARRCLDLGAFLSFSGIVTFKNATDVAEAATMCPDDRLLVETDSPYLAPVPHRGKPNRPAFVVDVGEHVARRRGVDPADLAHLTSNNASRAFPRLAGASRLP
jgi:TatD DNase family protein